MKTVKDLGRLIKATYPGEYDDLSDIEVGRLAKEKYPEYSDFTDIGDSFDSAIIKINRPNSLEHNFQLQEQLSSLRDFYNPNKGRLSSWWQQGKSNSRSGMLRSFNEEEKLLIERAVILENAAINNKKKRAEFQTFIATHATLFIEIKTRAKLIKKAVKRGLDIDTHLRVREEELLSEVRIKEYQATEGLKDLREIEKERALSQIKVDQHEQTTKIDLDNEVTKAQETVRLALLSEAMSEHQKVMVLQDAIDIIYHQIDEIEKSNLSDKVKRLKIDDRMEIIKTFQEDRRARQNRLLQTDNG